MWFTSNSRLATPHPQRIPHPLPAMKKSRWFMTSASTGVPLGERKNGGELAYPFPVMKPVPANRPRLLYVLVIVANHNPCMPRIPIRPFPFPPSLPHNNGVRLRAYSLNRRGIIFLYDTYRVPECLFLRPKWLPPPPHPQASVSPPQQHSLAGEGAGGANSDDWRECLALCILCGLNSIPFRNTVKQCHNASVTSAFSCCR
jgi:hypothetical protein